MNLALRIVDDPQRSPRDPAIFRPGLAAARAALRHVDHIDHGSSVDEADGPGVLTGRANHDHEVDA